MRKLVTILNAILRDHTPWRYKNSRSAVVVLPSRPGA
jgi:hypothetical protein